MNQASNPTTSLFRRLAWQSTIPLEIRLADESDVYYMQVPRYTYLPLLIPEIRENFVEVVLDDQAWGETDEKEWWFEEDLEGEGEGAEGTFASQGPCKWHWTIDLIHLHSLIARPSTSTSTSTSASTSNYTRPLKLLLHLRDPPMDKINLPNGVEQCRTQWVNQVKEADFVRWRNTNRSTGMRKGEFDSGWDGIVNDDFDSFSRFASRILPASTPIPASTTQPPKSGSTEPAPTTTSKSESAYAVRALPVKIYLPDNAPVIHELVPPLGQDGKPQTVLTALHTCLPLLFPPRSGTPYPIAYPILQGVELPPEAELAWLSTCCCGADGWLRIGIVLRAT